MGYRLWGKEIGASEVRLCPHLVPLPELCTS